MDVFLSNLPQDITDKALKTQLAVKLSALGIQDWACNKQRKTKNGTITFLHAHHGESFLQHHGAHDMPGQIGRNGKTKQKARLYLFGGRIFCHRGRQEPDPFHLKALQKASNDLQKKKKSKKAADQDEQPKSMKLAFDLQSVGLSCGYYTFDQQTGDLVYVSEVDWNTYQGIANFSKYQLTVTYTDYVGAWVRLEIPYRIVETMVTSSTPPALTLTLWEVPRIFAERNDVSLDAAMARLLSQKGPKGPTRDRLTKIPQGNADHGQFIGQCLVYRLSVLHADLQYNIETLRSSDLFSVGHQNVVTAIQGKQSIASGIKKFNDLISECSKMMPFDVLYQLQALVQNAYLLPWTVDTILRRLAGYYDGVNATSQTTKIPFSAQAIKRLFPNIPFPGIGVDPTIFEPDSLWDYLCSLEELVQEDVAAQFVSERARDNLTWVFKAQVSSTGLTFHGPELEAKNRVLRRFPNHVEYFLRVQFSDEDGQNLRYNPKASNEAIYQRFKDVFQEGFAIGGRHYSFLGFSHSSLRSHSAWFMAPFFFESTLQTYFTVISHLGRFENIYSPARCAARIGQAFSETPFALDLTANGVSDHMISDITRVDSKGNEHMFTDGVGTISQEVVDLLQQTMPQRKSFPTCFQIRWGGAKGMVALDTRLTGRKMMVRGSMVKFETHDKDNLEICDSANKPIPLVLNRQMIKIMEDMKVSNDFFIEHQNRELNRLSLITAHTINTVEFLRRQRIGEQVRFAQLIRWLDRNEIDYKKDRFLSSIVEAVVLRELRLLKHKARIPIEEGVTLFGICDETSFLAEDEVFVTFNKSDAVRADFMKLDRRQMLVTRSPAMHPGDIQIVTNVIPPDDHPLRSLQNCIVFSQKGERDMPSQLSGGDLDGDIFSVIWDEGAINEETLTFKPAEYPRVTPYDIGRVVQREDMTEFFVQFMATDQLGLLANKHMVLADQKDAGTVADECKKLAEMSSTAVDYSKTGIAVDMAQLRAIKFNRFRPDFMAPSAPMNIKSRTEISFESETMDAAGDDDDEEDDRPQFIYYESNKILGVLYRAIDEKRIWHKTVRVNSKRVAGPAVWDALLLFVEGECLETLGEVNWKQYESEALKIRETYEDMMYSITMDYSEHASMPITELEVFTGNIFNKSGAQTPRQRDRSIKLKEAFDRMAKTTVALIRKNKQGHEELEADGEDVASTVGLDYHPLAALELSLACLHVGRRRQKKRSGGRWGQNGGDNGFQSFPVVAASCLTRELDIALRNAEIMAGAWN
ncbi:RNA-dependent RNA polymerase [Apiospora kogelbergensis]|uniref:RNA-dependent RNA polymerase n=1 Tax=Apiospora kogelbergensis TaxID=1337665 RepID=UPI0031323455